MVQDSDAFAADLLRGHTDTIVLGVLRRGESYGFEIYKTIRDATGGAHEIKEATLYATYRRLDGSGVHRAIDLLAAADLDLRGERDLPEELVMEVLVARLSRLGDTRRR